MSARPSDAWPSSVNPMISSSGGMPSSSRTVAVSVWKDTDECSGALEVVGVKWPKLINNFVLLERATPDAA